MKEKFKILKELWKKPKYHALIVLSLYAIFFLIIFLIIIVLNIFAGLNKEEKTTEPVKTTLEKYVEMDNYEYTYNISYVLNNTLYNEKITGTKYKGLNGFKYLNNNYSIENDKVLNSNKIETKIIEYNLIDLEPINIESKLLDKENVKTTYKDGTIKKEYKIVENNYNLYYIVYEKDNLINKIEIDVSELIKLKNKKITSYNIEIIYSNIDNIISYD